MRIRSIFHPSAICARPGDTLRGAADLMHGGGFGALPVYAGDRLAGIFTERDLAAAVAGGADPGGAKVGDWMSADPAVADPEEYSRQVAQRMLAVGARHLPVVEAGKLIGMVSARDLLLLEAWPSPHREEGGSG
jgi:CBS domain-containing protein